jgi:DNA-binding HxlR family transcriptional regulator
VNYKFKEMLRTKEQVSKICDECPLAKTANIIGDTFTLLIIRDLLEKPRRFGDIEHSLSGVSSRTITKKLKFLEEKKIIKRTQFSERPPRVEYSLTSEGKKISKIIDSMRSYGKRFL